MLPAPFGLKLVGVLPAPFGFKLVGVPGGKKTCNEIKTDGESGKEEKGKEGKGRKVGEERRKGDGGSIY